MDLQVGNGRFIVYQACVEELLPAILSLTTNKNGFCHLSGSTPP